MTRNPDRTLSTNGSLIDHYSSLAPPKQTQVDLRLAPMQSIKARTAKEFLRLLSPNGKMFSHDLQDYIFRGQADAAWPIIPRVLRRGTRVPYEGTLWNCPRRTNREQIDVELGAIRNFGKTLNRAGHHVPYEDIITLQSYPMRAIDESNRLGRGESVWPPLEYHSLIALAQHNGLPTRFLDFSYSASVATYFAASGALKRRGNPEYSGELAVYTVAGLLDVRSYEFGRDPFELLLGRQKGYCYQLIEAPTYFNGNLKAQKACFLAYLQLSPQKNEPCEVRSLEDYLETASRRHGTPPGNFLTSTLYKITLGAVHAEELLRLLRKEGTDASTVFPSISGCVDSMFEACEDEPPAI